MQGAVGLPGLPWPPEKDEGKGYKIQVGKFLEIWGGVWRSQGPQWGRMN